MAMPCSSSTTDMLHTVYLGLGSNIGDKEANIHQAVQHIEELIGRVDRQSALVETEPWGFNSPNKFVNAAVCCLTTLSPHEVLATTQHIERTMGRTEKSDNGQYHDRKIDIDILLYDNINVNEPDLIIPHPLIHKRDFVMMPLKEIMQDGFGDMPTKNRK